MSHGGLSQRRRGRTAWAWIGSRGDATEIRILVSEIGGARRLPGADAEIFEAEYCRCQRRRTLRLLRHHGAQVRAIVVALLMRETLSEDEITRIL
jgi:hypothetical protein